MFEQIACDRCGRSFATEDAPGMLAAITGPCPSCGGRFRRSEPSTAAEPRQVPAWRSSR